MIHMIKEFYINHFIIINILTTILSLSIYLTNIIVYRDTKLIKMGIDILIGSFIPCINAPILILNGLSLYINILTKHNVIMQQKIKKEIEQLKEKYEAAGY